MFEIGDLVALKVKSRNLPVASKWPRPSPSRFAGDRLERSQLSGETAGHPFLGLRDPDFGVR